MQLEFANAMPSARTVAPRNARCGGRAEAGGAAASSMRAGQAQAGVHSGHDDENRPSRRAAACVADRGASLSGRVAVQAGKHVAYVSIGARAMPRSAAIVLGGEEG
jgi:Tfp pilus assembly protein FimT